MKSVVDNSKEENQAAADARRARGEFVRGVSQFRHVIGESGVFPAEPGRYHLFVALNCPWCHRVTLARGVLGLTQSVSMDVAYPNRTDEYDPAGPNFWQFAPERRSPLTGEVLPECTAETGTGQGYRLAQEIYAAEGSEERSVPILYDKRTKRIVSNESAEIVRMLGAHARALGSDLTGDALPNLYPNEAESAELRREIDELNTFIYVNINNGSYKAGFSSDQAVYATAFENYFAAFDELEAKLKDGRPFLTGERFTEVDLRLFPTLYRHDPVYYVRMKLNGARLLDYPHLWHWLCRVYALPGVVESGSLIHCRQGYFGRTWNKVIPSGPIKPMRYPEAYRHPDLVET
ncbi:glutathione S-transferase C-terminal domain-containing protein [Roseobacter sp. YSTF-M11]|uniref:Glutathione S-transferase C-terminal domain-containing protein n=1 Tax=Roseobacter insulae TaxID=2859783 RepID=A0A9X1JWW6_9RHOB|nr:glutathione S-transferase C-terminal domain-containing protein [Roseobacter insulae]MBW4706351.1 glutathione S-transferase C-terminal domain-containing protein [Roseobacter insulae]